MFRFAETFICEVLKKKENFLLQRIRKNNSSPSTGNRYAFMPQLKALDQFQQCFRKHYISVCVKFISLISGQSQ
jgi:hypothetical protein